MKFITGLVLFLALTLGSQDAEARGVAIINTGEDVIHVSEVKEELRAELEAETMPGVMVGMIYSRFGVFWLDIWRWDSRYVLYQGDNVWEDVPPEILEGAAASGLKKPFTMTLPPGLIVLVVGGIGFGLLAFFGKDDDENEFVPAAPVDGTSGQ